jgi:hypothetical protein
MTRDSNSGYLYIAKVLDHVQSGVQTKNIFHRMYLTMYSLVYKQKHVSPGVISKFVIRAFDNRQRCLC